MAELLDRLLSRQRKRNPFSDVMGPDPLESAAMMDTAQGVDVSMPAPVGGRSRMADGGEGALAGGGGPFRTAGGGGAAPIQAAVQGGGGKTQATQTQCPGGRCPSPRRTVTSGPQYFDDGGFPVTSTVVGSPTVSSSAPMMTGGPVMSSPSSVPFGDSQGLADLAWQQQQMGQPAARALAERLGNRTDMREVLSQNAINDAHTRKTTDESASQSRMRLLQEIESAKVEDALKTVMTQDLDEGLATSFIKNRQAIEADFNETGDVRGLTVAYARLMVSGAPVMGSDGQPMPQADGPIPVEIMQQAEQEAYGTAAINALLGNAIVQRDAANLGESFNSRLVPRGANESAEAYAARAEAVLSQMKTDGFYRASSSIISGLKQTEVWKQRDMDGIQQFLDSRVRMPTEAKMRALYAKSQPADEKLPPRERRAMELARDAEATRQALAFSDYVRGEAQFELTAAGEPQGRTWQEWAYGEDQPDKPRPVDSNDTLPNTPARGANPQFR